MRELNDILLILDAGGACDNRLAVTERLAREHGAFVQALCRYGEPELPPADCFAIGETAVGEVIDDRTLAIQRATTPTEVVFRTLAASGGLQVGWKICAADTPAEELAHAGRTFDLTIAPRPEAGPGAAAALVLHGGPCLFVPEGPDRMGPFEHIVVAWNGSRECSRAVSDALPLLTRALRVDVVLVGDDPGALEGIMAHLRRHGVAAQSGLEPKGRGGAAEAILDHCIVEGADLLVVGAFGRAPALETVFGGVSRELVARAPVPVLMSH